jgi:MFS family permease
MDQWWHTLYGFDVTLVSPPHVGLILSIMVSMAGCLMAFAWHVRTAHGQGPRSLLAAAGCALAAAALVMFVLPTLIDLVPWVIFDRVSWPNLVVSLLFPAMILLVAVIVRRPWAGTLFGLFVTLLDGLLTVILPAITQGYAASIGLFLRDNTSGVAFVPALAPTYVLAAGIVVDLLLEMGRRFGWRVAITVPLAGAAAALTLQLLEPTLPAYQPLPFYPPEVQQRVAARAASVATSSLILAPIVGALAGWFGWLFGIVLAGRAVEEPAAPAPGLVRPAVAATAAALLLLVPLSAQAHSADPHHETIQAGPYTVLVGFSEWPMRAERSLDITFEPEGGIADKSATLRLTDAQGEVYESGALGRHPRMREMWGLDLIALPTAGDWTIELTVEGPEGSGAATLSGIPVGERPGPPPLPFWIVAALPLLFLLALGVRGWRAVRPGKTPEAHAWA